MQRPLHSNLNTVAKLQAMCLMSTELWPVSSYCNASLNSINACVFEAPFFLQRTWQVCRMSWWRNSIDIWLSRLLGWACCWQHCNHGRKISCPHYAVKHADHIISCWAMQCEWKLAEQRVYHDGCKKMPHDNKVPSALSEHISCRRHHCCRPRKAWRSHVYSLNRMEFDTVHLLEALVYIHGCYCLPTPCWCDTQIDHEAEWGALQQLHLADQEL